MKTNFLVFAFLEHSIRLNKVSYACKNLRR